MKNKQEIVKKLALQIFNDIEGMEFDESDIHISTPEDHKKFYDIEVSNIWTVFVSTIDQQFGGHSHISIKFKEEDFETFTPYEYDNAGAEGRTPFFKIEKKDGKYKRGDIW